MFLLASHHLTCTIVVHAYSTEYRFGVARSEGSKTLEVAVQLLCDVAEVDFGINIEHRLGLFGLNMLVDIFLEAAAELLNVVPTKRQSGRIGMSAKIDEQVAATLYGRVDVKTRNAACRTRSKVAVACEHHSRTEIDFGESRSHNAYHTLLPVLVVEHYRRLVALALESRHDVIGILGHLLVDVLALVVVAVDVLSLLKRVRKVLIDEQIHTLAATLHTS